MHTNTATIRLRAASGAFVLLLASCASYSQRTSGAYNAFLGGRFDEAVTSYADTEVTKSTFLSGAEAGTAALAAGDWDAAIEHLSIAASFSEEIEGRALAGPGALAETLSSWVFNDTSKAYEGEGFERVYVHACLGLAYLAKGQLEDVYVEARRANALLEAEEELYEAQYAAGGFGNLLSALAYELLDQPDQAWIDYQRMLDKGVAPELAGRAMQRLAPRLSRADESVALAEQFGAPLEVPADYASVIVLAGVGLAPGKVSATLALPTPHGIFQSAVPRYEALAQPVSGLRISHLESGIELDASLVENVEDVATRNLADRVAWMGAKSALRGIGKVALTKELAQEHGVAGQLAGDLFTMFSERADLRAWRTLPANWQAARLFVPPGVSTFELTAVGGERFALEPLLLESKETLIIIARSVDRRLIAHVVGGTPVHLEPTPSEFSESNILPPSFQSQ